MKAPKLTRADEEVAEMAQSQAKDSEWQHQELLAAARRWAGEKRILSQATVTGGRDGAQSRAEDGEWQHQARNYTFGSRRARLEETMGWRRSQSMAMQQH